MNKNLFLNIDFNTNNEKFKKFLFIVEENNIDSMIKNYYSYLKVLQNAKFENFSKLEDYYVILMKKESEKQYEENKKIFQYYFEHPEYGNIIEKYINFIKDLNNCNINTNNLPDYNTCLYCSHKEQNYYQNILGNFIAKCNLIYENLLVEIIKKYSNVSCFHNMDNYYNNFGEFYFDKPHYFKENQKPCITLFSLYPFARFYVEKREDEKYETLSSQEFVEMYVGKKLYEKIIESKLYLTL